MGNYFSENESILKTCIAAFVFFAILLENLFFKLVRIRIFVVILCTVYPTRSRRREVSDRKTFSDVYFRHRYAAKYIYINVVCAYNMAFDIDPRPLEEERDDTLEPPRLVQTSHSRPRHSIVERDYRNRFRSDKWLSSEHLLHTYANYTSIVRVVYVCMCPVVNFVRGYSLNVELLKRIRNWVQFKYRYIGQK